MVLPGSCNNNYLRDNLFHFFSIMTCTCARAQSENIGLVKYCTSGTGNYDKIQQFADDEFCVDETGYQYTPRSVELHICF